MANDLTQNPFILDTAHASNVLTTEKLRVKGVRWVAATTAGHTATLKDGSGKIVWTSVAAGANNVEADKIYGDMRGQNLDGLMCTALQSGKLYVELL